MQRVYILDASGNNAVIQRDVAFHAGEHEQVYLWVRLFVTVVTPTHEVDEFAVSRNAGYVHGVIIILPVKSHPSGKEILLDRRRYLGDQFADPLA